jgi:exopolysaccharide biosynthesis polyprenyl glycosylphosphotransferase
VGFAEDGRQGRGAAFHDGGYAVGTLLEELPAFLQANVVDEVLICLPVKSYYTQISAIIHLCEAQGITVRLSSDFFSLKLARSRAERFGSDTVVTIYTGAMTGFSVLVKRCIDVCVASLVLLGCAPIFLAVAFLIKVTSRGPVFFVQERVGLNKRRFKMYKFRTMVPGAEKLLQEIEHLNEVSGPVFKVKDDPRVTTIGRFLRRTSLDELPQILNVLKGDMSLVGPRPLPIRDYEGFDQDGHRRRFSVRPGMTCTWQVNGRSNIPFEQWMQLDLEYIDQWTLWLDLKILFKTLPAVFKKVGAT